MQLNQCAGQARESQTPDDTSGTCGFLYVRTLNDSLVQLDSVSKLGLGNGFCGSLIASMSLDIDIFRVNAMKRRLGCWLHGSRFGLHGSQAQAKKKEKRRGLVWWLVRRGGEKVGENRIELLKIGTKNALNCDSAGDSRKHSFGEPSFELDSQPDSFQFMNVAQGETWDDSQWTVNRLACEMQ